MSDSVYDFGLRIKKLREKKGLSQSALADRVGVESSTISGYERNVKTPSLDVFIKLVQILGVSADYLLGFNHNHVLILDDLEEKQREFIVQIKNHLQELDLK